MKAILLKGLGNAVLEEVQVPKLEPGDLLVKMRFCGLCGTDLEKLCGHYTVSKLVLGHEPSGTIAKLGAGVNGFREGERVFAHHHVPCYQCYYCTHGSATMCPHYRLTNLDPCGFAEFFRVSAWSIGRGGVLKVPDSMTFEEATFVEPTACCIRGLSRSRAASDQSGLVVGAGPIGLIHLQLMKSLGMPKIFVSDMVPLRLNHAERLGAYQVYDASEEDVTESVLKETDGRGVDLAVVASGSPQAILQALRSVRKGGRVSIFGIPPKGSTLAYDLSDLLNKEVSILTTNAATELETKQALEKIAEKQIDVGSLVTHRFSLDDFGKALDTANRADCLKVLIMG